ncbi:hypothetical protein G7Y89_g9178 [Cudoniella acicularis]|uniref:Uncharacterized protein n=1 Tax=Cudoniella acicularis TaxID=354080 RepID=A0A8H4RHY9_9HELO|nr:hypothetical protein G7Y89_g9178 [Cudoniella acicularis]
MDPFEELEQMALNAASTDIQEDEPSEECITRWQSLFQYSPIEAKEQKENQGYDREAYEHELEIAGRRGKQPPRTKQKVPSSISPTQARFSYLLKMEGPLSTPAEVQDAASLSAILEIVEGSCEEEGKQEEAAFCIVDGRAKHTINLWLSAQNSTFKPTFARLFQKADKQLSPHSMYPTLGVYATLPQNRPSKYLALVDEPTTSRVDGPAYLVQTQEHEETLRDYETDNYEVVRCEIAMELEHQLVARRKTEEGISKGWRIEDTGNY